MTLRRERRARFSKTARLRELVRGHAWPHRGQLDAVRRDDGPVASAIGGRRLADDLAERPAEGPEAGESDVEADVSHAAIRFAKQEHRALDPPPLEVAVRRLPEHSPKASTEVRR